MGDDDNDLFGAPAPVPVLRVPDIAAFMNVVPLKATNGDTGDHDDDETTSWLEVDLTDALEGRIERPTPTIGITTAGVGLFYPGRVNGTHGDSGIGKSMLSAWATAGELIAGRHAAWIDFEEPDEGVIVERLRMFGTSDVAILERFHYYRPQDPITTDVVTNLTTRARLDPWAIVVVDSVGEAFGLQGIDENKDVEVGPWLRNVARVLADAGPAVNLIDHATKAADNPLHPSGSKRKRAAITGASYLVEAPSPLTRAKGGRLKITCAKDRHGNYARGKEVATLEIDVRDADIDITCRAPATHEGEWTGPQHCIEAVVELLVEVAPVALNRRSIASALQERGRKYRSETVSDACRIAADQGLIAVEPGPRGARLYSAKTITNAPDYDPEEPF